MANQLDPSGRTRGNPNYTVNTNVQGGAGKSQLPPQGNPLVNTVQNFKDAATNASPMIGSAYNAADPVTKAATGLIVGIGLLGAGQAGAAKGLIVPATGTIFMSGAKTLSGSFGTGGPDKQPPGKPADPPDVYAGMPGIGKRDIGPGNLGGSGYVAVPGHPVGLFTRLWCWIVWKPLPSVQATVADAPIGLKASGAPVLPPKPMSNTNRRSGI